MSIWPSAETTKLVNGKLGTGYNDMPPNWEEIKESEYYWRWSIMPAHSIFQHRGVILDNCHHDVSLFVHPGDFSGIGFWVYYDGKATEAEVSAYKPHYFKWKVCDHDFKVVGSSMCFRRYKCKTCGYEYEVDSSG